MLSRNNVKIAIMLARSYSSGASHHKVVVIGGGTGGLAAASILGRASLGGVIIDPSVYHYYQPGWTLVGAGLFSQEKTRKNLDSLIPSGYTRVNDAVTEIHPETNYILTKEGQKISYDFLVVAAGIQINWDAVEGLQDALGKDGVVSNYGYDYAPKTAQFMSEFKGGNAIFTQPSTPIKCAGAPQKIMYLAEEHFRDAGVRDKTDVKFYSGMGSIFGVKKYAESLSKICKDRNIQTYFQHNLTAIRPNTKEAVFKTIDGKEIVDKYDFIHVTPPMGPPAFLKNSPLADQALGFVDVNKETLQHTKYPNVFALGDCSNAPKSRTAAAISHESQILAANLIEYSKGKPFVQKYTGYASCPLVTGKGKLILAEFDYSQTPMETFGRFIDQSKESKLMYYLKKEILPPLYWAGLITGKYNRFALNLRPNKTA